MAVNGDEQPPREPAQGEAQSRQEPEQEAEHPVDARLRVYLRRLVDAQGGRMRAADALGVNNKTLARGLDEPGPLTVWLRAALFVKALDDGVAALAVGGDEDEPADPGAEVPAGRIGELAGDLRDATEVLRSLAPTVEQLHREHGERVAEVERRLGAVEGPPPDAEGSPVIGAPRTDAGPAPAAARPRPAASRAVTERPRPASAHVVTEEAGPDDEDAYGAAWPLVEEWRDVRARHPAEGKGVDWLRDEERLRELEIALIGEHELALPPERYRWDGFTRRAQQRWRERTLRRVRKERGRAQWRRWRRRLLTLGLWRS